MGVLGPGAGPREWGEVLHLSAPSDPRVPGLPRYLPTRLLLQSAPAGPAGSAFLTRGVVHAVLGTDVAYGASGVGSRVKSNGVCYRPSMRFCSRVRRSPSVWSGPDLRLGPAPGVPGTHGAVLSSGCGTHGAVPGTSGAVLSSGCAEQEPELAAWSDVLTEADLHKVQWAQLKPAVRAVYKV